MDGLIKHQREQVTARETWVIDGFKLVNVHTSTECAPHYCLIHNPSEHHMREWPVCFNAELMAFRTCEHGVWHPDPDTLAHFQRSGLYAFTDYHDVIGCDGCCDE